MNHEVEDGADVDRAAGERSMSFSLDELRPDGPPHEFLERRVEPFDVPHLEWNAGLRGEGDEVVRLRDRPANRLLDQNGNARAEERGRHRVVVNRRRDDADRIHSGDERFEPLEWRRVQLRGDCPSLVGVGIDHPDEFDVRHPRQNPRVVLAQMPDADYCHPQARHSFPSLMAATPQDPKSSGLQFSKPQVQFASSHQSGR